jgi:hypothetical protein
MGLDPLSPMRFAARHAALDGALTADQAAVRLGLGIAAVNGMAGRGELAVLREGGAWRFPSWQFTASGTLPGLLELLAGWPGSIVALTTWVCTSRQDLGGRTPAAAMRDSDESDVMSELALHPPVDMSYGNP